MELDQGWNNFVWLGEDGTDAETALECLADQYAIAYRFDALSQTFQRYVPGHCSQAGLCNIANVNRLDTLLVLFTGGGLLCGYERAPASMLGPTQTPTPEGTHVTPINLPSPITMELHQGWNNFVWLGEDGTDPETALECLADQYAIAYRFDALSQTFQRYVPGRCSQAGVCNVANVNRLDSLLVLVTSEGLVCGYEFTPIPIP